MSDERPTVGELIQQAREAIEDERFRDADDRYFEALQRNPDDVGLLVEYGGFLVDLDDAERAVKVLQFASELDRENPDIWANIARAYFQQGKADLAARHAEQGLRFDADHDVLKDIIAETRGSKPVLIPGTSDRLEWTVEHDGERIELSVFFPRNVTLEGDVSPGYDRQQPTDHILIESKQLAAAGDIQAAIELLEENLDENPHERRFEGRIGRLYFSRGEHEEAAEWLEKSIEHDDNELAIRSHIAAGNVDAAQDLIDQPSYYAPIELKALQQLRRGALKAAKRDLSLSLAKEKSAHLYALKAVCQLALGSISGAKKDAERALEGSGTLSDGEEAMVRDILEQVS